MRTVWSGRSRAGRAAHILGTGLRHAPLLVSALGWVCLVRLGLSLASHRALRRALLRRGRDGDGQGDALRVAWAVHHAARVVPGASCLTQALAAQIMLSRRRVPSVLHLGVDTRRDGFGAHAWLEAGGRVILGNTRERLADFARIASFPA